MTEGEKSLTIRLPARLLDRLREHAKTDRRSLNAHIVWILERRVQERDSFGQSERAREEQSE